MRKYNVRLLFAATMTGTLPFQNIQAQPLKEKLNPNIIFILTDDLGYGDLGVLFQNQRAKNNDPGKPWALTPNLDQMANNGVQLSQHYCAAPVCAPSRASLLLGQSQGHANVRDNQFDKALDDNYTLGSVMQKAGYSTAIFGKWGLQGQSDEAPNCTAHPLNRGFDYFLGYIRHKDGHEHYPKEGIYDGPKEVYENRTNIVKGLDKCYTTDLWTAAAKKWIADHEKGKDNPKPFFIYLAYDTPHAVLELPTQAYPNGRGLNGGMQWIGQPGHMITTASEKVDSWMHPDYANATYDDDRSPITPEAPWPDVYKRYATDTRRIDNAVGDIMQLLKDLNIDRNTIIIFSSDNGPSRESYLPGEPYNPTFFRSFGPFDGIKRDCWEGGVRMPTLAMWPGHIPAGSIVETPSISYDWMATFTDIVGLPAPAVADGVSLLPSLIGEGKQTSSNIYIEYFHNGNTPRYTDFTSEHQGRRRMQMQMIRIGDYVGVRYDIHSAKDNFEIYNVVKDPQQSHNLAGETEIEALQQKFKEKALQLRMPDNSAVRPYDDALIQAVSNIKTESGLEWKGYDGVFPWVPEVATLVPVETGIADQPNTDVWDKQKDEVLYFDGFIRVPEDGEYAFFLTTDKGALLRIHDATVIDADYGYFRGTEKRGDVKLKKGLHPIRIYYAHQSDGRLKLNLGWSGPGFEQQPIPASLLFHSVD
jgi:arylsulfatase A-like enzyme